MNPLVAPAWLAARLHDRSVVIFDATLPPVGMQTPVDTHARYLAGHIPHAVFFDIEELSDHSTSLPHMLPSAGAFSASMAALGAGDGMTMVVYEQTGVFSAPRAWWMLKTFGAKEVYLLDGDLRRWTEEGLPVESGSVSRKPANFTAKLEHGAVKNFTQMREKIQEQAQILDARSSGRFAGSLPEPRPGLSSGHMPGAISVPFLELVEDGRLRKAEALRGLFTAKGVNLDAPVTTTCGSGVTAAVVALGLAMAGAGEVSLYDGSWAEYAQHPQAIIETGS